MQKRREGGLTEAPDPQCLTCGGRVRRWPVDQWFDYCKECCPHKEWFPYAGTGDDICKQCGTLF